MCLVVDDEPAILRLVTLLLQDMGCDIVSAPNAEAALVLLQTTTPDLIITDVKMPGVDGAELTRLIKSNEGVSPIPVLLMSAYGEPRGHVADAFIAKPFDIDTFSDVVAQYIKPPSG